MSGPGMRRAASGPAVLVAALALAGCGSSSQEEPIVPDEQRHAADTNVPGAPLGHHRFLCEGRVVSVDFQDGGARLRLWLERAGPPLLLAAPQAGMRYEGADVAAVFDRDRLTVIRSGLPDINCNRTRG